MGTCVSYGRRTVLTATLSEIDPHVRAHTHNRRPRAVVIYHSLRPRFGRNREIRRTSNRGECCKRHYT